MQPQKLDSLQGIKASESKALKAAQAKNAFYREALGIQMGEQPRQGFSIMATLTPQQLRSIEPLGAFLEGEENGADTLDMIFRDANSFDELSRQLSAIGGLMVMLDSISPERDFTGRKKARNMLATLSLQLKKTARIAAKRPGQIGIFN